MLMCRCAYLLPSALPRPKINLGGARVYVLPMQCDEKHCWVPHRGPVRTLEKAANESPSAKWPQNLLA